MTGIPLNIDWQQILLHMFNFALLVGGLYILLYRPVRQFIDHRTAYYQSMDEEARQALDRAQQKEQMNELRFAQADEQIAQKQAALLAQSEQEARETVAQAQEQAKKILAQARARAQAERQDLVDQARGEIAVLAIEAAKKAMIEPEHIYDSFLETVEAEAQS